MRKISKITMPRTGVRALAGPLAVVALFSGIGFIGYRLYANPLTGGGASLGQPGIIGGAGSDGLTAADAPKVDTADDLDAAAKALQRVDAAADSAGDINQLDMQIRTFAP